MGGDLTYSWEVEVDATALGMDMTFAAECDPNAPHKTLPRERIAQLWAAPKLVK